MFSRVKQFQTFFYIYIYVALMDEAGEAWYYEKHLFTENKTTFQIITDQIPVKAGIDPYLVLIDREMDNNMCEVKEADDSLVSLLMDIPARSTLLDIIGK